MVPSSAAIVTGMAIDRYRAPKSLISTAYQPLRDVVVDLRVTHSPDTRRCTSTGTERRQRLKPSGTETRPFTISPPLRSVTRSKLIVMRRSCERSSPGSVGDVVGWPEPGLPDGHALGEPDGLPEGEPDGLPDGDTEGDVVGLPDGDVEGDVVGLPEGEPLGVGEDPPLHPTKGRQPCWLGEGDGDGDALPLGLGLGLGCCSLIRPGKGFGEPVGLPLGLVVGEEVAVGDPDGLAEPVGDPLGELLGELLGDGVSWVGQGDGLS